MAIYHCSISNVSRSCGASSCATLAYIIGKKVYDERLDTTYKYARSERVLEYGTIIPEYAPAEYDNPKNLFNAIEKHETADNARTAKKIEVALPKELDLETQKQIVEDYINHNLTSEGYCVTYAIHDGGKKENDHAHILVGNRPINEKGEWACKRKTVFALDDEGKRIPAIEYQKNEKGKFLKDKDGNKIPVLDENGNTIQKVDGKGTPQWVRENIEQNLLDNKDFLFHLRREWAAECNKHLEQELQIDHRSNKDRHIKDTPTIHEGYAAREREKRGEISERCQENREIRYRNEQRRKARHELAIALLEDRRLQRKEREIHERLRNIGRGNHDYQAGRTPEGERPAQSESTAVRTVTTDDKATGTRDYTAELLAHRREAAEREIARISKEREAAARAEREASERNRQLAVEREKRNQQKRELAKPTVKSHEYTFTR